jgi:chemotaxis response regulator CheB
MRLPSEPGMKPIRIVVADANLMACGLVSAGLKRHSQFEVVGYAMSVDELLRLINDTAPDVALIGSTLQDGIFSGLSALPEIHSKLSRNAARSPNRRFGARGRGAGVPSRR